MTKRVVGTDVNCAMCPNRGPPSSFFIVEKQEEDDPEMGDEDAPIPPLKIYMCPGCFKGRPKEELKGCKITMPLADRPADKLVPMPKKPREPIKEASTGKGGLFA
jgi:hypothetical protein